MRYIKKYASPMGELTMISDGKALTGLFFDYVSSPEEKEAELTVFDDTQKWLDCYFSCKIPDFLPPLDPEGSPFGRSVWRILQKIPYGKTVTYGEIADIIAKERKIEKMSAQAVGGAVGRNPVSIIIPCHRVVGKGGSMTGYAGGIARKIKLLELEGYNFDPKELSKWANQK